MPRTQVLMLIPSILDWSQWKRFGTYFPCKSLTLPASASPVTDMYGIVSSTDCIQSTAFWTPFYTLQILFGHVLLFSSLGSSPSRHNSTKPLGHSRRGSVYTERNFLSMSTHLVISLWRLRKATTSPY